MIDQWKVGHGSTYMGILITEHWLSILVCIQITYVCLVHPPEMDLENPARHQLTILPFKKTDGFSKLWPSFLTHPDLLAPSAENKLRVIARESM